MIKGGTKIYCPFCKEFQECQRIDLPHRDWEDKDQRKQYPEHKDLAWFERQRKCLECKNQFTTVEIDKDVLDELIKLRATFDGVRYEVHDLEADLLKLNDRLKNFQNKLGL